MSVLQADVPLTFIGAPFVMCTEFARCSGLVEVRRRCAGRLEDGRPTDALASSCCANLGGLLTALKDRQPTCWWCACSLAMNTSLAHARHSNDGDMHGFRHEGLTPKVSGAGAPQVRRAPTQAMKMPKAWPVLASA